MSERQWLEEGAAPDTPMPRQKRVCLSADEATAVVSAAFGEDHDAPTFDRAIKRLGDFVDRSVEATNHAEEEKR